MIHFKNQTDQTVLTKEAVTQKFIQDLPDYYAGSSEVLSFQDSLSEEGGVLNFAVNELINQLFLSSATWGLERWEKMFGLETDSGKSHDYRRSVIRARRRTPGTLTKEKIKDLALAFENGEIEIREKVAEFKLSIEFVGLKGVPPNFSDFTAALAKAIPAHIGVEYFFRYLSWEELDKAAKAWSQFDALALTWDQLETYSFK